MRDYYAVLGVGAAATPAQIRRAYRQLARRYSPDVNLWDRDAQGLFEEISVAYRVLSDPTARELYDRHGASGFRQDAREGAGPPRRGARRGDDLHVPVEISFQQAVSGVAVDLSVDRLAPCEACAATGARRGASAVECAHCGGTGSIWTEAGVSPCPACEGHGQRVADACPTCRGRGIRPARGIVRVALPAGMDTGAQVRIPGAGHAGPFGGPQGDLIVITRVHEDAVFTRKGDNLHCELPITIVEAVLGARVPLKTLGGEIDLVVPAGAQAGQVLRARGRGMPRLAGDGRGDLYVTLRVEVPRGIDSRTQEMFRELGRLLPDPPRAAVRGQARA